MIFFNYDDLMNYENYMYYAVPYEDPYVRGEEIYGFNPYYEADYYAPNYYMQYDMRQKGGKPTSPPPAYVPEKGKVDTKSGGPSAKAVDPASIRRCRYKYVYIWERSGRSYWMYITYVGRRSIAGWRWTRFGWVYFGLDTRKIDSFVCV